MKSFAAFAPAAIPVSVILLTAPAAAAGVDAGVIAWLALFGLAIGYAVSVDLVERRIPNVLTYTGTALALVVAAFAGLDAFAAALGGAVLAAVLVGAAWWFGRGSLGMGDVKFSALVGAVVGLGGVMPYLLVGTAAGAVIGLAIIATGRGRRATFAYGPALAVGAVAAVYLTSFTTAVG